MGSWAAVAGPALSLGGSLLQGQSSADAARAQAQSIENAARQAAEMSRFRPVGITTGFGTSSFETDKAGNVTGAGYSLTPEMQAQQAGLLGMSGLGLQQYQNAFQGLQPLGAAGQGMMGLGAGYLATSPQEQAQKYMAEQQALLAPSRQAALSNLQNTMFQQGRSGLAVGGGDGMQATNPEMAAYYNAIEQQDRELAARSTQGGMDYARFGAGMLGLGGDMTGSMYDLQSRAFEPYKTALGGAQYIEGLGQQAMGLGVDIGAKAQGNAGAADKLLSGLTDAAAARKPADAYNPWASLLSGAGNAVTAWK